METDVDVVYIYCCHFYVHRQCDNDFTHVPVTISVFRVFKVSPIPFILAQVLASNVGGAATLIGDPPNIIIGSAEYLKHNDIVEVEIEKIGKITNRVRVID